MFDRATKQGRILDAALTCAAAKSWADVSLRDIATAAEIPFGELRAEFNDKSDLLAALLRATDEAVLRRLPARSEGFEPRDQLFDVIMTRFDVLAPYKGALRSIDAAGAASARLAPAYLASQHWMLEAAGIPTDGARGALRVAGLAMLYASVFRVWLHDDDPGLARTMAALDRRLRRGERGLRTAEQLGRAVGGLFAALPGCRGGRRSRGEPETPRGSASGPGAHEGAL
jgi:AcrR family transcriptional regulator